MRDRAPSARSAAPWRTRLGAPWPQNDGLPLLSGCVPQSPPQAGSSLPVRLPLSLPHCRRPATSSTAFHPEGPCLGSSGDRANTTPRSLEPNAGSGGPGPIHWNELFPIADGDHQSLIEIKTKEEKYDSSLRPLIIKYDPSSAKIISNSGHSFSVGFDDTEDKSVLQGGPLTGSYRLRQFHLHLGCADDHGSEHVVNGVPYAAKLHVVHWNSDKYPSFVEAAHEPDGLAVGVFLQIGKHNSQLQKVTDILDSIKEKEKQTQFTNFDPLSLLPPSWDYWTYPGSLTVPPLLESVTWIILKQPINISSQQLAKFCSLLCTAEGEAAAFLLSNHRPPQLLKGHKVRVSFR
ncbi:LOW QUALITY PROTEIN: carbonic anhydrase 13 [Dugong dugon]